MTEHGSNRTIVLALVPAIDSSFLQTLNLCLLKRSSMAGSDACIAHIAPLLGYTSELSPSLFAQTPHGVVCRSGEEMIDFLHQLCSHMQQSGRAEPRMTTPRKGSGKNWATNWIQIATGAPSGTFLAKEECNRLLSGVGTIQNVVLATSGQLQSVPCLLSHQKSNRLFNFFDTDHPC